MASFVDVDDESVLSSIFKESFPDSWRGNSDFTQYLTDLSSFGVERLYREPERLAEEKAQILEQTQDLAFHNYKTFIETAECSREIFQDFQIIESHVEAMLQKLPLLVDSCQTFTKQAQDINASRRMNNVTLARNTQLLEILEMPQLMDTCVRNGYYEEALELANHVRRLEKKHGAIPVIMDMVEDIKKCCGLMLKQLIQQLRSNVQLPACLKVIGYLRRMQVFSDAELRIKFLQARDTWFQSILAGIPTDDPYYHVTKTIEASRVHLFDMITQYRAVFSDDDPLVAPSSAAADQALFHGWLVQKVSQFLGVLEADLQRGVGPRLDSLLGQCMYFGLSFSRVGADFRGLLAPIFQRAALTAFRQAVSDTDARLDEEMQSFTLLGKHHSLPSSAYSLASQGSGSLQAPIGLLEVPPLAAYCNGVLTAFNEMRLCAPLSLACDVLGIVQQSLCKAAQVLLAYHRAEETTFNEEERARFSGLCAMFVEELVPHVQRCLQHLFPPALLASTLGLSTADLAHLGNIGSLDMAEISSQIAFLLPAREPEPQPASSDAELGDVTPPHSQPAAADVTLPYSQLAAADVTPSHNQPADVTQPHSQPAAADVIPPHSPLAAVMEGSQDEGSAAAGLQHSEAVSETESTRGDTNSDTTTRQQIEAGDSEAALTYPSNPIPETQTGASLLESVPQTQSLSHSPETATSEDTEVRVPDSNTSALGEAHIDSTVKHQHPPSDT